MAKQRLDILLVEKNLAPSRERAKTTIMAGLVLVDGQKIDKAGTLVKAEAELRVPGRIEAGQSHRSFRRRTAGENSCGYRSLDRRFYRLLAAKRSGEGVCN